MLSGYNFPRGWIYSFINLTPKASLESHFNANKNNLGALILIWRGFSGVPFVWWCQYGPGIFWLVITMEPSLYASHALSRWLRTFIPLKYTAFIRQSLCSIGKRRTLWKLWCGKIIVEHPPFCNHFPGPLLLPHGHRPSVEVYQLNCPVFYDRDHYIHCLLTSHCIVCYHTYHRLSKELIYQTAHTKV